MMSLKLVETDDGVRLTIKAVPGSSRDRVVGMLGEVLKIAVAAPPQRGAANQAILALVADQLRVHPSRVTLRRGQTSARKELFIAGMTAGQVRAALGPFL